MTGQQQRYGATDLSDAALGGPIRISNGQFSDNHGRVLSLRGLNVSGISKLPTSPNGLTHLAEGFYETHRTVSFISRPFPLNEADLHFRRLQAWGMPLIRLLVTWESIGHAGPDPSTDLDLEYMEYLKALIQLMPKYGLKCFVCAHQDVWSRFSGGSGAPAWTFEAAGLNIEAFTDTGAAYIHSQDEMKRLHGDVRPDEPSGPFQWPSGYQKLAASTMATLFWAGDVMAPKLKNTRRSPKGGNEQVSIQTLLQDAFVEAFGRLSDEIGGLEACIGFEPMNEPHRGLVNLHDFDKWNYDTDLHIGHVPSFAQALALGSGYAQDVDFYVKSWPWPTRVSHRSRVDPNGRSTWLRESIADAVVERAQTINGCIWRAHGVWEWDEKTQVAQIQDRTYFNHDHRPGSEGQNIEWYRDCYAPFLQKFAARVTRKWAHHLSFVEPIPNEFIPPWSGDQSEDDLTAYEQDYAICTTLPIHHTQNMVYAPHFYDLNVLFGKMHGLMSVNVQGLARKMFVLKALYFGAEGLRRNYFKQIVNIVSYGKKSLGQDVPTVIGEVGIPWDINDSHAFKTGDYDKQRELMHALVSAMEGSHVGFTLWNYNPYNTMEHGDGWNKEDFSVIHGIERRQDGLPKPDYRNAAHEQDELYRGGRALDVIIRPYATKMAGTLIYSSWDPDTLRFELRWQALDIQNEVGQEEHQADQTFEASIFLPNYHYADHEIRVQLSSGTWEHDPALQTLFVRTSVRGKISHTVVVTIEQELNKLRGRMARRRLAFGSEGVLGLLPISVQVWWELLALERKFAMLFSIIALIVAVVVLRVK